MITLEKAQALIAAGIAEASEAGLALAFAVVDPAGHLVASARMDGAPWIAPEVALGKAWTAAAYGLPSAAQGEKMQALHAFSASISVATGGRYTPQIGGLPVLDGDTVIGAMGASGGTGQQDEDVVRAAVG
jgi:glc operon protein GlcG